MERKLSKRVLIPEPCDKTGGNGDCLKGIKDGEKTTIMNVLGVGLISHIWITIALGAEALNRNDIIIRYDSSIRNQEKHANGSMNLPWERRTQLTGIRI